MVDLDEYDPPVKPDFRRIGKQIPYVIPPEGGSQRVRYSRSSNSGKILDDESNLTDWKLRTVVAGAAQRPELMAAASVLDIDMDKKTLRDIAEKCLVAGKGERRSVIGTAVHSMFDHIDKDDGWLPPPNFRELCDAYVYAKEEWGFEIVDIEIHCINDEFRLAGTLDRRYRTTKTLVAPDGQIIPIGSVLVADHKTGKELEYSSGSYCTQLAAYVDSVHYDVLTDERTPFDPPSNSDWALIVHADSAGTRVDIYWVDVNAGRKGLRLANEVKGWRRRDDLLTIARLPHAPPSAPTPLPVGARLLQSTTGADQGPRLASRADHLRTRVRAVIEWSEIAAKALQRDWPRNVRGLKNEGHSWEDLDAIQSVIEKIEADYSVPFGETTWIDPVDTSKERHPSNTKADKRKPLMISWLNQLTIDDAAELDEVINVLLPFANLSDSEWSNDDIDLMLVGSLRAMGVNSLAELKVDHAPYLLSAAFALAAGNAILLFDEQDNPIVRIPNERGQ
jgi:hypothetical protein